MVEAHFQADYSVVNCWMASVQPSLIRSIAITVLMTADCGHFFACYECVPSLR